MELMAERWTEERLDDLKHEVVEQGRRMDEGFHDLRVEIGGLRKEVGQEIGGLRTEMSEKIGGLRTEMGQEIGGLRAEMRQEIGGLRTEMGQEIGGLRTEIGDVRRELGAMHRTLILHLASMFAAMIGLAAALVATQG